MLKLLRQFGRDANSFQVLQRQFQYWFCDDLACVAYVDTGRAWVAAGAPIAAKYRLRGVALAFVQEAKRQGRRASFFGTESRWSEVIGFKSIAVGMQPHLLVDDWLIQMEHCRKLKAPIRRARAEGLRISHYYPSSGDSSSEHIRREVESLTRRWLASKALPPLGFLAELEPFLFAEERRYFVARVAHRMVGFAVMTPIYEDRRWMIEHLVRAPDAPLGTIESLIESAMHEARRSGSDVVTLGLTPLTGEVSIWLRIARRLGSPLYNFGGLERFRNKLRPRAWTPVYIACPVSQRVPSAVYDSLVAFARGSLTRYAVQVLTRRLQRQSENGHQTHPIGNKLGFLFAGRAKIMPAKQ